MQTGYIQYFFIFPVVLDGCCVGNHKNRHIRVQRETTRWYYRVVEEEVFMMPCNGHDNMLWSKIEDGSGGNEELKCETEFHVKAKHSGNYTCQMCGSLLLHLQVVENSMECFHSKESEVELVNSQGGYIACPGQKCTNNTDIVWFKGRKSVAEQGSNSCQEKELLYLCQVKVEYDAGVFFCDRQIIEHGVIWTFRRAVKVTVIPIKELQPTDYPKITYPSVNTAEKVEVGQSHNLTCEVLFPYENKMTGKVQWHVNDNKGNIVNLHMERTQNRTEHFTMYKVTQRVVIKEVTSQHLSYTYTCIASNIVGKSNVTIKLKEKIKVQWLLLAGCPIASLLLVAGVGIFLHVNWLELQLIYRSHLQCRKHEGDEKDFDVFLSYVWTPPSPEVEGSGTSSSCSEAATAEEAYFSTMDPLNPKEGEATQKQLEVLLPQVLEKHWGYRLCLLERDIIPGGVYTNDVICAIQRSQMLICLLSPEYLCNSNAVFVLESGVQALLQNSAFKLLLIWINRDSTSLIQQDPPLSTLIQRALKVLPSLNWTGRANCNFLKSLRKAMPGHKLMLYQ